MSEFSDTVRAGIARLSALGRPDVRLHLPRHHAIASWTTPEGREPAFIAQTMPLRVDPRAPAEHARAQERRGGRRLEDLRQPHWQCAGAAHGPRGRGSCRVAAHARGARPREPLPRASPEPEAARPAPAPAPKAQADPAAAGPCPGSPASPPPELAPSYRELVELDHAHSVRPLPWRRRAEPRTDALDLEMLELLADFGHVLSSQLHRRFHPGRAPSTTQRRLKRLADGGLVDRFQFHRRDGGGVPVCYRIAPAGVALLEHAGRPVPPSPPEGGGPGAELARARREVHAAGWALALARLVASAELRGPRRSTLPVPRADGRRALGPGELRLPGGRVAHEFRRTSPAGERGEADRFQTLRPHATVLLAGGGGSRALDVLVELDDRCSAVAWAAKLERYDHFLTGWREHTARYGPHGRADAVAVFVCRDRHRARLCAARADALLCACRAYPGEYPRAWEFSGRESVLFAAERDAHEGLLWAWGPPALPAHLREPAGAEPAGEHTRVRRIPPAPLTTAAGASPSRSRRRCTS